MEDGLLYSKIGGFFYDGDGTLYDTEEFLFQAYVELVAERGHAMTEEQYRQIVGQNALMAAKIVIDLFSLPDEPAAFLKEREARTRRKLREVRFMPGAEAALNKFRYGKTGAHAALVTSAGDGHVFAILDALNLRRCFKEIVTADTSGLDGALKPNPAPYRLAAKKMHALAHRCIAFEDTPHGATSARDAGMIVIGIPHRFSPREALAKVAHHVMPEGQSIGDFEVASIQHLLPQ